MLTISLGAARSGRDWLRSAVLFALALTVLAMVPLKAARLPTDGFEGLPTAEKIAELRRIAAKEGWQTVANAAYQGARIAYERDQLEPAYAWLHVARWSGLFAETEGHFVQRWVQAINQARTGHANMQRSYAPPPGRTLADFVAPALQEWLLLHREFSATFFEVISPCDFLPEVLSILTTLHRGNPQTFEAYSALALAIAIVYDVPPPPGWPHAQVSEQILERRWLPPAEVFTFFVDSDRSGKTLHRLAHRSAEQLKYVVDLAAPVAQLRWAQRAIPVPLAQLASTYELVPYRTERVAANAMMWPGPSYDLASIVELGGICVDQAYVATQAGKARGVPTMIFRGAGLDGRHAWFGYLDGNGRWQMDVGRFAEQRFVTGLAHDPQTWSDHSDHEIHFLSDGFRLTPRYRQAQIHAAFASTSLSIGDLSASKTAARMAINYESRHLDAWNVLLTALRASQTEPRILEAHYREAAIAFQRYPDLQVRFGSELAGSLRARGESSAADFEERLMARKHQGQRLDLSVDHVAKELSRALVQQPPFEQMRLFRSAVEQVGRGAGVDFFDRVIRPFFLHWVKEGRRTEALRALEYVRTVMMPAPGSQLDTELIALALEGR